MLAARVHRIRLFAALVALALAATLATPASAQAEQIKIVRDRFGVPHVFAETEEGASYGAGYALARDRLWQMHVFRLIGKGRLSDLLGPVVVDIDKDVRFFTYTAEERAARFETYAEDGKANLEAFVAGINAWIDVARTDPRHLPFEFQEYGVQPIPEWTIDDSLSLQDVLILAFGSGGGNELGHAALLADLIEKFGANKGRRAFDDLVVTEDPDGPMTIPRNYDYTRRDTFARHKAAQSRRALTEDARLGLAGQESANGSGEAAVPAARGTSEQLGLIPDAGVALEGYERLQRGLDALRTVFKFGSNAQIAAPSRSEAGSSLQTAGPQVGYLLPQWLADFGMHGGDFDTTGMTFAGAGPAVLIGRGPGYAWTTTTGAGDLTDTYVEKLNPDNPREYEWKGSFEPMDCRTETYTFRGTPFESEEICRTRHGPVVAFDEENDVAYSLRYAWFNREGQTVEGFFRYNEVESVQDFATFSNFLSSNHNMFYVDDQGNYGFWHPGNHPVRTKGIDIRLPQDGTGGSEWQGLRPLSEIPHAVNFGRGWLANWNNQPAAGWKRERGWPALDNATDIQNALNPNGPALPDPEGGLINPDGLLDFEDLSANLRYAAFKDHRDTAFRPFLPRAADLSSDLAKDARNVVAGWDGFLVDRNDDGLYDSAGKTIVDRWVSLMRPAAFGDDLGELSGWAREDLLWHQLNPNDRLQQNIDWLNGQTPARFAAEGFEKAAEELAAEFESEDPSTWREDVELEHYQRLNADLFTDLAVGTVGGPNEDDQGFPGDVADHIEMDRGTYNHVVAYQTPPTAGDKLGRADVKAGSVIPPGQCGFINIAGQECPHYEDELELYLEWRYKPMPLSLKSAMAQAESVEEISFED